VGFQAEVNLEIQEKQDTHHGLKGPLTGKESGEKREVF
jgi:hypothetical protein